MPEFVGRRRGHEPTRVFDGAVRFPHLERYLVRRRKGRSVDLFKVGLENAVSDCRCLDQAILALVSLSFFGASDIGSAGMAEPGDDETRRVNDRTISKVMFYGNLCLETTCSSDNIPQTDRVDERWH